MAGNASDSDAFRAELERAYNAPDDPMFLDAPVFEFNPNAWANAIHLIDLQTAIGFNRPNP